MFTSLRRAHATPHLVLDVTGRLVENCRVEDVDDKHHEFVLPAPLAQLLLRHLEKRKRRKKKRGGGGGGVVVSCKWKPVTIITATVKDTNVVKLGRSVGQGCALL